MPETASPVSPLAGTNTLLAELILLLTEPFSFPEECALSATDRHHIRVIAWLGKQLARETGTPGLVSIRENSGFSTTAIRTLSLFLQEKTYPAELTVLQIPAPAPYPPETILGITGSPQDRPASPKTPILLYKSTGQEPAQGLSLGDDLTLLAAGASDFLQLLDTHTPDTLELRQSLHRLLRTQLQQDQTRESLEKQLSMTQNLLSRSHHASCDLRIQTRIQTTEKLLAEQETQDLQIRASHYQSLSEDLEQKIQTLLLEQTESRLRLEQFQYWQSAIQHNARQTEQAVQDQNTRLTDSNAGLDALRDFLSHPAPLWRRILRALRKPFVPHIPTLPPTLSIPTLPDLPPVQLPQSVEAEDMTLISEPPAPQIQSTIQNILFIAGEPDTPGVAYRCDRNADAARHAGFNARIQPCATVGYEDIQWADVMVFWRVEYSGHVGTILDLARENDVLTIFDADDIVFVPHYARIDLIDGIRSIGATEERIERCFTDMRRTLLRCDQGSASTEELAHAMHELKPVVHLLPNVYDEASLHQARLALRMRGEPGRPAPATDPVRIGYATGSRTHQRDFARACSALAEVLAQRPQARLVLFREKDNHRPVLLMEEFPALRAVESQIEWRDMVPLSQLPAEFARFDISIAPLETGNVFCEAKSEIKFFEPALAGSATIVSPTAPFRRIVRNGETGLLADTEDDWKAALLTLIDNPGQRLRMARDAYHDVLWPFSPQAQSRRMKLALTSLRNDEDAAASVETLLARQRLGRPEVPVIPDSETLFHHDALAEADVSVVITSYNYAAHILDALDSVASQTLLLLDLIVVDDGSTDDSTDLVLAWMERKRDRFNRLILRRSLHNAGLGGARNIGMDAAETPFILQLDADNTLRPAACDTLLKAMTFGTAYAYPVIECFGEKGPIPARSDTDLPSPPGATALLGDLPFHPLALVSGNRVDAMAMIAKWAWAAAGGYYVSREAMGWEDFDLWCTFAEMGLPGHLVPDILADYRQHDSSMTNTSTEKATQKARVVDFVQQRHPWIRLTAESARQRL
ncbi:glycosyltransferase [Gluconobacter morbifer]|uniref:Glycosyltransferase n=1 Tax=Gluconobacter morbifer G707 TaxID=1088869 RepID=G6XKK5_9PROT|nr:glycosyltransferase [Gluconobacter morbifer]EHH67801.1 glycosyltransferase [Gluconobacter morbifer G707]